MIDNDDCGAIGGMRICKENRSTRRKPATVPQYWKYVKNIIKLLFNGDVTVCVTY
jgi:hypothetical protein